MLFDKYSRSTHIGNMNICIVPAQFHESRINRFTITKVNSIVNQRWKFEGANSKSSFTLNNMIAVIIVVSVVAIVKKKGFN